MAFGQKEKNSLIQLFDKKVEMLYPSYSDEPDARAACDRAKKEFKDYVENEGMKATIETITTLFFVDEADELL